MLPRPKGRKGRLFSDARLMLEAIVYRYRRDAAGWTGGLLAVGGPDGCRARQHATNTRASQAAGSSYKNLREEPPDHGIGRSRGGLSTTDLSARRRQRASAVTLITPGQAVDPPMLLPLMAQLRVGRDDKTYSSRAIRGHLRTRGVKTVILEPDHQKGHRKHRGSRGGRRVGLDAAD